MYNIWGAHEHHELNDEMDMNIIKCGYYSRWDLLSMLYS